MQDYYLRRTMVYRTVLLKLFCWKLLPLLMFFLGVLKCGCFCFLDIIKISVRYKLDEVKNCEKFNLYFYSEVGWHISPEKNTETVLRNRSTRTVYIEKY
jgi:hypothetical protein